ncbi:MAG: hypothetical protein ABIH41_03625 [Nanoarchaeota archaeon]
MERALLDEEFSLERKDEEIAKQLARVLAAESTGDSASDSRMLTSLAETLLEDEKRRKRIIEQILKLQKRR